MSIVVAWHNVQKTVIRHSYEGEWTWHDFHNAIETTLQMTKDCDGKIDLFLDLHNTQTLPPAAITHFRQMAHRLSDQVAFVVATGGTQFMKIMFSMFQRVGGHWAVNYMWATTFDEACGIVSARQKLPACQVPIVGDTRENPIINRQRLSQ